MRKEAKLKMLKDRLRCLRSVVVAFSGGVDSAFLLKVARDVLGEKVCAVTARSETYTFKEEIEARALAKQLGVRHRVIVTRELENARFRSNPENRCYYCKSELFGRLKKFAAKSGFRAVIDGSNKDDLSDFRPGTKAIMECGVVSPLQEAGLGKAEIRVLSKKMGLPTWSKPSMACLASRMPYGTAISVRRLKKVAAAEAALRKAFSIKGNLRVRDYGPEARVEVDKNEVRRLAPMKKIMRLLGPLGYGVVAIDPAGYRTGSLNSA
jgi:uncharacterized protein